MSPIQEETGCDDGEEGDMQEEEPDPSDSFAESVEEGKKKTKKFKKAKREQASTGWWNTDVFLVSAD